jgi:hypothetical protein
MKGPAMRGSATKGSAMNGMADQGRTPFAGDAQTLRLAYDYAPSTFDERGTTVPFTTPELAFSRVRRDNRTNHLEVLVMGFSGSRSIYVFPWEGLTSVLRLTLHDRALQAEISLADAITPLRMRIAAYRVAKTGLAGPEAAAAAALAMERIAREEKITREAMLRRIIRLTGVLDKTTEDLMRRVRGRVGDSIISQVSDVFARLTGQSPELCRTRLLELSDAMGPLGFSDEEDAGYLRRTLRQLGDLRVSISAANIGATGHLAAETAGVTARMAERMIGEIDREIRNLPVFFSAWEVNITRLRQAMDRLAWLLDGWLDVCELWQAAMFDRQNIDHRRIAEIMRVIPLVPKGECETAVRATMENLAGIRHRIVQQLQDWRTGEVDYEVVSRIEAIKARTAAL